ncbi:BMC domain-containing protein [Flavonifractor porci]|uniref:BMC domain-containing protein n=1 Tax=Flavonifractor porci TaxID=3133422 RepID=UPI0030AB81D7
MQQKSLGLIETQGLAAGIVAADAAVKSANVELVGYELTKGGGWTLIKVQGDVGAVKAAVDAASMAAGKVNRVVSTRVIARPSSYLETMIHTADTVGDQPPEPPKGPEPPPPTAQPEPPEVPPVQAENAEKPPEAPEPGEHEPENPEAPFPEEAESDAPQASSLEEREPEVPEVPAPEESEPDTPAQPEPEKPEEAEVPVPEEAPDVPGEASQSTRSAKGNRRGKNKRS